MNSLISTRLRLFVVSVAVMLAEMILIRWIGTEVRIFAYVQNLALIACFLGFGLGCFQTERLKPLYVSLAAMLALVLVLVMFVRVDPGLLSNISNILSLSKDAALWGIGGYTNGALRVALFLTAVLMVALFVMLLAMAMIPLGQRVALYLAADRNVIAGYSINLVGSLVGTWLLTWLSFRYLGPAWWFGLCVVLVVCASEGRVREIAVSSAIGAAIVLLLIFGARKSHREVYWSPYQKLEVLAFPEQNYQIDVNNIGYMRIANVTPQYLQRHPGFAQQYQASSYDSPFHFAQQLDRVLVVGAGAGNDVAAALRHGVQSITAVEIDPVILLLGKRLHPENPYGSARVRTVVNDARNYMRTSRERFDAVIFCLLDSHTEFSAYTNMRLDNYVYTREAIHEARSLLKPGGILILKFEVRAPWTWMGQRFYAMLESEFGRAPVVYLAPMTGTMVPASIFIESDSPELWKRASQAELSKFIAEHPTQFPLTSQGAPSPTTDDWPYIYHSSHWIPRTYLIVFIIVAGLAFLLVRNNFNVRERSTWEFFLLGAGFLLMETQLTNRLALYFGSTWMVNCIAISAILATLVMANMVVLLVKDQNPNLWYAVLVTAILANYAIPWDRLALGSRGIGITLSVAYAIPVFCAGIIFATIFRQAASKSNALGSNVFGAVVGGLMQNLSFILGLKALLLVAGLVYGTAGYMSLLRSVSREKKQVSVLVRDSRT
jgi:spermidine synthase